MLEAQLAADTHKAEIVLAAFDELEGEIRWRQAEAAGLAKRHHHFLNAALRERASLDMAAVYTEQKVALERTIASLLGLDVVTGGRSALREIAVQLPRFNVAARLATAAGKSGPTTVTAGSPSATRNRSTRRRHGGI